jgi:hypothetical protein
MPNWCSNKIVVSGDLTKFKTWLNGEPLTLNKIVPMDQALLEGEGWYDWRIENWETKWDVEAVAEDLGDTMTFSFESAWAPPTIVFAKLAESFPEIKIVHSYLEEGMCFVGKVAYAKGCKTEELYYEDPSLQEWKDLAAAEFNWEPYTEE